MLYCSYENKEPQVGFGSYLEKSLSDLSALAEPRVKAPWAVRTSRR